MKQNDEISLQELIEDKLREGISIEFKKAENDVPKDFWPTYSAFANTAGGRIFLGVEEGQPKNIIRGVNHPNKLVSDLFNLLANKNKVSDSVVSNPDVVIHEIDHKQIIIVHVPEAPNSIKPVYLNNRLEQAYIRKGDGDYLMDDEMLRTMIRNASPVADSLLISGADLEDLDPISVTSFKEKVSIRYPAKQFDKLSPAEFLLSIGALAKDKATQKVQIKNATLLFLGKYQSIRAFFPSFHLDYFNRKNTNTRWTDRVASDEPHPVEMNIFQFYHVVSEKLRLFLQDSFQLDSNQVRMPLTGFDEALREALVNCLVHADYAQKHPSIRIEAFDRFFTFLNPGQMLISYESYVVGGNSRPRNEQLMSFFRLLGLSERQGFGGAQIFKSAYENLYRLPDVDTNHEQTKVKIWYVDLADSYPDMSTEEKTILRLLVKSKQPLSSKQIQAETGYNEYKVRKAIGSLQNAGHVRVLGQARSTRYSALADFPSVMAELQSVFDSLRGSV